MTIIPCYYKMWTRQNTIFIFMQGNARLYVSKAKESLEVLHRKVLPSCHVRIRSNQVTTYVNQCTWFLEQHLKHFKEKNVRRLYNSFIAKMVRNFQVHFINISFNLKTEWNVYKFSKTLFRQSSYHKSIRCNWQFSHLTIT